MMTVNEAVFRLYAEQLNRDIHAFESAPQLPQFLLDDLASPLTAQVVAYASWKGRVWRVLRWPTFILIGVACAVAMAIVGHHS